MFLYFLKVHFICHQPVHQYPPAGGLICTNWWINIHRLVADKRMWLLHDKLLCFSLKDRSIITIMYIVIIHSSKPYENGSICFIQINDDLFVPLHQSLKNG